MVDSGEQLDGALELLPAVVELGRIRQFVLTTPYRGFKTRNTIRDYGERLPVISIELELSQELSLRLVRPVQVRFGCLPLRL